MTIEEISALQKKRWALPVLALLDQGAVPRAYPLSQQLPCSRTATTEVIRHLLELGYLVPNPGHGHPLRPEFLLSARGHEMARLAQRFWQEIKPEPQTMQAALGRWSLPILYISQQPARFGSLRRQLAPVTDRALSLSLKSLTHADLLVREIDMHQHPPSASYLATSRGQNLIHGFQ
jgi:DNA-binding HxlR family transcriptional regulator